MPPADTSGSALPNAAWVTPGIARIRSLISSNIAALAANVGPEGSGRRAVRRLRGIVATVDVGERLEAAAEQAAADEQHAGDGHLTGHDCRPQPCGRCSHARADGRRIIGKRLGDVETARLHGGEERTGRDGGERRALPRPARHANRARYRPVEESLRAGLPAAVRRAAARRPCRGCRRRRRSTTLSVSH